MNILSTFDLRTILACQFLLSVAFAIVFLAMKWAYRQLNGIGSIAFGFLLTAPGVLLMARRGSVSELASVVLANALILSAYLYFYLGVLRFFAGRRRPQPLAISSAVLAIVLAVLVTAWFSIVHPGHSGIVPRIVAVSVAIAFVCTLLAVELFREAAGRTIPRLFALFMSLFAAFSLYRGAWHPWFGAPPDVTQHNSAQALAMVANIVFICALGIFFQLMIASELTQAIEHRARLDLLTGTLNRAGIEARLSGELDRAHRNGHPLSAVLIDIDHFKSINDSLGHAAGDQALRSVAQCIASSLRSYDLLGRYGGDEFLLLLPETHSRHAVEVAERIRVLLGTASQPSGAPRPTVSIGITETLPLDTPITLLARADAALYDAKHAGRNCVRRRVASAAHPVTRPLDQPAARSGIHRIATPSSRIDSGQTLRS